MDSYIEKIHKLSRVPGGIIAGYNLPDVHNRIFTPDSRFFLKDGYFKPEIKSFIEKLSDNSVQEMISAGIGYYDIRSQFWRENPEFTVIFALSFAKKLQEKLGREDGITLHIGVDAYKKHFEVAQIFVDTILRTGICDNGGAIYYWGVINGGDIRNYSQFFQAVNGDGGNWIYFTMSHRPEDYLGAKMGIDAQVYCGPEIRHVQDTKSGTLYDAIINKEFAKIKHSVPPQQKIITIQDFLKNNIQVAADVVRATSAPKNIKNSNLLKGIEVGIDMKGSPIGKNLVDILEGLGASVKVNNSSLNEFFDCQNIIDPNEHKSPQMQEIYKKAEETGIIWLVVDPDGDRGTFVALDSRSRATSLTGAELLLLATENLANVFNKKNEVPTIICDMRACLSAKDLEEVLNNQNLQVKVVPVEAGYPFFMKAMAEIPADLAIENTCHEFMTPMTNSKWGAPVNYPGYQGGDNAAIFLIYILGCIKYQWEGKNPALQLEWLREKYNLKKTFIDERKPSLSPEDDRYKYLVSDEMKKVAANYLDKNKFLINLGDPSLQIVSGIHITNIHTRSMVLIRYSNTGPGFTISGEAYSQGYLKEILALGYFILKKAVDNLHKKNYEFKFFDNDAEDLKDKFPKEFL